jgi:hypothetical protein
MKIQALVIASLLLLTSSSPRTVAAPQPSIACPTSEGQEYTYMEGKTKNYQIKICILGEGTAESEALMLITKDGKTTIARAMKDDFFIATWGDYTYEVVTEGHWNPALGFSESIVVAFTITKKFERIVNEKIIPSSVGGYFMLP